MNSAGKYTCKFTLLGAAAAFVCRYFANMKGAEGAVKNIKKYFEDFAKSEFVTSNQAFFNDNKKGCLAFFASSSALAASGLTFNGSKNSCTFGLMSLATTIATFSMLQKKFVKEDNNIDR